MKPGDLIPVDGINLATCYRSDEGTWVFNGWAAAKSCLIVQVDFDPDNPPKEDLWPKPSRRGADLTLEHELPKRALALLSNGRVRWIWTWSFDGAEPVSGQP